MPDPGRERVPALCVGGDCGTNSRRGRERSGRESAAITYRGLRRSRESEVCEGRERSIFQKSKDNGNIYEDSLSPRQSTVSKVAALHVEESNNQ